MQHHGLREEWMSESIQHFLSNGEFDLREQSYEFLNILYNYHIPTLIFSAGIGNMIDIILKMLNLNKKNISIVGNRFLFKDGIMCGTDGDLIHSLNKNYTHVKIHLERQEGGKEFLKNIENRKNIIVVSLIIYILIKL
jgi:5'-nucleotidase